MDRGFFVRAACCLIGLVLSAPTLPADQLVLEGNVPESVDTEKVERVWEFVKQLTITNSHMAPPKIRFVYFDCKSGNALLSWQEEWVVPPKIYCENDSTWLAWKEEWHKKNPSLPYPLPNTFLGYHFEGTNVIQIARRAFSNEQTVKGLGYRILGHEMLHYIFEGKVAPDKQHCLFKARGYPDILNSFLIETGIGVDALRTPRTDFAMGVMEEGCDESSRAGQQ